MSINNENMTGIVQHRRGTTEEWNNSPIIPYEGELVIEECDDGTRRAKVGDGKHTFKDLSYVDAATEANIVALKPQVSKNSSDINAVNTAVSNLKREVDGVCSAIQSIVDPSIEKLDAMYSTRLNAIETQHNEDKEEIYSALVETKKELSDEITDKLAECTTSTIEAVNTKTSAIAFDLTNQLKASDSNLQKQMSDLKSEQTTINTNLGSLDKKVDITDTSLTTTIKRIEAGELKINELVTEVTKLKELGYVDFVTSEMIGQLRAVEAKVDQLSTSDITVLTHLYAAQASIDKLTRQLKDLQDYHNSNIEAVNSSFNTLKKDLRDADSANLEQVTAELTKLWKEITDLVDDDIALYNHILTTRDNLNSRMDALKTESEDSAAKTKKELTDTLISKEAALNTEIKVNAETLSKKLDDTKVELKDSINSVKATYDANMRATDRAIQGVKADIADKHTEVSDKIANVVETINQHKVAANRSFDDVDNEIIDINNKIRETNSKLEREQDRIDSQARQISQFVRLEAGSTTGDAELLNIRVNYDGTKTYDCAGDHVRVLGAELANIRDSHRGIPYNNAGTAVQAISEDLQALESDFSQYTSSQAINGLHYDAKGEVGIKEPYILYLKNAEGNIILNSGVRIISGAPGVGDGNTNEGEITIEYITPRYTTFKISEKPCIEFNFSGTDKYGNNILEASATWTFDNKVTVESTIKSGYNSFDLTNYLVSNTQLQVHLHVTDNLGSYEDAVWDVKQVEFLLTSDFNDKRIYTAEDNFIFKYIPTGTLYKKLFLKLDGNLLKSGNNEYTELLSDKISGDPQTYENPEVFKSLTHGTHILEAYLEAEFATGIVRTDSVFKEILIKDSKSKTPIIGAAAQQIQMQQYDTVNIIFTVYDPRKELPIVDIYLDDSTTPVVRNKEIPLNSEYSNTPTAVYPYNALTAGPHKITIVCGSTSRSIDIDVESIDTDLSPITAGLAFDFNPVLCDNSKDWKDQGIDMTCSDNFDWENGGYKVDENGDQYFCVKAGTTATINYNLFADNAKEQGKEFKVIFRTKNIRRRDTSFLRCLNNNIGLDMRVENATIYDGSTASLRTDYCEDTIIEYEFNINVSTVMPIVMSYEDGTPSKPYKYTSGSSFTQPVGSQQPIIIGSDDCDVHIYRIKAYNCSLTDKEIKKNFIADARTLDEKLARFNRNNIYDSGGKLINTSANGDFFVESLMKAAPDLRYIFLEVPQFTADKDNKIDGCTVYFRYPAGTRPQDNWTCTGVRHRGQGTSSNAYGYAGRNLDLCMDRDESLFTWQEKDEDGNTITKTGSKITLTDTSVPTDYLNIKVNIASSENANNAELARRFNNYQPFLRYARKKNSKVKDTMEFYNCVVFIRETSKDPNVPHREFKDTNWHFYAIGNIGDSKKTDDTRVNNANDPKEHVVEIMDVDVPLATFPRYIEAGSTTTDWGEGNKAYDILYSNDFVYDDEGAFKSFGGTSFEFRYEMDEISDEQRMANITTWRNFYDFVVTSTDEDFYANLKDYFVVDSALYYYLFTERYMMVDNRAKNSFWHYGKVYISNEEATALGDIEASYYIIDDEAAAINNGYRYDLTFGYDMDTALGIDNTGDYVFAYGKEDTDYYRDGDPTSGPVFRANTSTFFCKLRDLFKAELRTMFQSRENANAWSSDALINQWDTAQSKFPEELWRLDYERKYYRTYQGISIDESIIPEIGSIDETFLIGKFFGRKKYARRAFETNQEIYFATKYFGKTVATDTDTVYIRGNTSDGKQNYSITIVPYLDMYPLIKYGSTGRWQHGMDDTGNPIRLKAGQSYTFEDDATNRDFIYLGAPSWIQAIGDLSKCYISDNSFARGERLQSLIIGDGTEDYINTNLKSISVSSNVLLEYLDLSNVIGLEGELDLTKNVNLKTLKVQGTSISGINFAPGGKIAQVELPLTITKITLKDLKYLSANPPSTDPEASYFNLPENNKVQTLIIENCPKFTITDILDKFSCTDDLGNRVLKNIRLTEMSFGKYTYDAFIADFDSLGGVDINGNNTDSAWLAGTIYFEGTGDNCLTGEQYNYIISHYPGLEVSYEELKSTITFMNTDGETVYASQQISDDPKEANDNNGTNPVIPGNEPQKDPDSSGEFSYEFVGWATEPNVIIGEHESVDSEDFNQKVLNNVIGDRVLYPVFKAKRRTYIVTYINPTAPDSEKVLCQATIPYGETDYGSSEYYTASTPVKKDTDADPKLFTFVGWRDARGNIVEAITCDIELFAEFYILEDTWYTIQFSELISNVAGKAAYILNNDAKTLSMLSVQVYNSAIKVPETFNVHGESYTVVGVGGFRKNEYLELISLPDTITEITATTYLGQWGAFEDCFNLAEITLPENLEKIGARAFYNCIELTNISIPSTVTSIGHGAFAGCKNLKSIELLSNNKYIIVSDCLLEKGTGNNLTLLWGLPEAQIPGNVTHLAESCFEKQEALKDVTIPANVTIIPTKAFAGCTNLKTVTFSNESKLATIGPSSFSGCESLTSINLPEGLTEIGTYAFNSCALTKITIPSSVNSMANHSFGEMSSLQEVTFSVDEFGNVNIPSIPYDKGQAVFENSGTTTNPIVFNLPWTKAEHEERFGSEYETWGATAAVLKFVDDEITVI